MTDWVGITDGDGAPEFLSIDRQARGVTAELPFRQTAVPQLAGGHTGAKFVGGQIRAHLGTKRSAALGRVHDTNDLHRLDVDAGRRDGEHQQVRRWMYDRDRRDLVIRVVVQDEASSVVWGMPGAVAMAGICTQVLPLGLMAKEVRDYADRKGAP